MNQPFRFATSFFFVDLIGVQTIDLIDDIACLGGGFNNPLTREFEPAYFEIPFTMFYEILSETNWDQVYDDLLEKIAIESMKEEPATIELDEEPLMLHDMVFRLSHIVEEEKNESLEEQYVHAGYGIEDWHFMENGMISFEEYVTVKAINSLDKDKARLKQFSSRISGHLVEMALRYEYYRCVSGREKDIGKALQLSSLEDNMVFDLAKAAHEMINRPPVWQK